MGDLVLATPSVAVLRKNHPEAIICFGVGDSPFYSTIVHDPNIDRFDTPLYYNVWNQRERKAIFQEKIKSFDWVLLLDNPDREWWKQGKHLIDIYSEKCGMKRGNRRSVIYLDPNDDKEAKKLLMSNGIKNQSKYIVLAPETRSKKEIKEWPYANFIGLIRKISENHDIKIATLTSPENEELFPGTIRIRTPNIRVAASIIKLANLYIRVDNGLTHIAGAFNGPIVSLHIGFPRECCGVLSPRAAVISHEPFCRPSSMTVDEVYETVSSLLSEGSC